MGDAILRSGVPCYECSDYTSTGCSECDVPLCPDCWKHHACNPHPGTVPDGA